MDLFSMLSSSVRSKVISELLSSRYPLTLGELNARIGVSKSLLRYHLDKLVSAGVVIRLGRGLYKISDKYLHVFQELFSLSKSKPLSERYILSDDGVISVERYLRDFLNFQDHDSSRICELLLSKSRIYYSEDHIFSLLSGFSIVENSSLVGYLIKLDRYLNWRNLLRSISFHITAKYLTTLFPDYIMRLIHENYAAIDHICGFLYPERLCIGNINSPNIDYVEWLCINDTERAINPLLFLDISPRKLILRAPISEFLNNYNMRLVFNYGCERLYGAAVLTDFSFNNKRLNNFLKHYRGRRIFLVRDGFICFPDGLFVEEDNFILLSTLKIDYKLLDKDINLLEELLYRYDNYICEKRKFLGVRYGEITNVYVNITISDLIKLPLEKISSYYSKFLDIVEKFLSMNNYHILVSSYTSGIIEPSKISQLLTIFNGLPPIKLTVESIDDLKIALSYILEANIPMILLNW